MPPLNYAAFALDDIGLDLANQDSSESDSRHLVSEILTKSEKFVFPDAKDVLDECAASGSDFLRQPISELAQPICIEAPWNTRVMLTGSSALVQSSRRITLCWEARREEKSINGWDEVFDYYPSGGIFVLPIIWLDRCGKWEIFHTAAFLPHLAFESISTETETFERSTALLPPMRFATTLGALLMHPVKLLKRFHAKNSETSSRNAEISADLQDEVMLATYVMPLLPTVAREKPIQSDDDPNRKRRGKQSFFQYREISRTMISDAPSPASKEKAYITSFGLSTLRALNFFELKDPNKQDPIADWLKNLETYSASQINLLIGVNGAGKSTIIDMIDCLRDATKLVGLQRENTRTGSVSGFFLQLSNVKGCFVNFSQANGTKSTWSINRQTINVVIHRGLTGLVNEQEELGKFSASIEDVENFQKQFNQLDCSVHFFDGREIPEIKIDDVIDELCKVGRYLPQTAASTMFSDQEIDRIGQETINHRKNESFLRDEEDRVNVWLGDDSGQTNRIQIHLMPSGWQRYGKLTAWLGSRPDGSVCLIEEPETHLHPTLQRLLTRRLGEIAKTKSLQLFIATHSPTLMNAQRWGSIVPKVFEMRGDSLTDRPNLAGLLRDLGVRLSDFLQANGIVWVEGPSDAIYLRYWIETYCREMQRSAPLEDSQFSFLLYGGAMLSHFSVGSSDELVDMLRLNQNLVVLMDRDLDYSSQKNKTSSDLYPQGTKERIEQAVDRLNAGECWTWVTSGYTIESYLPPAFRDRYFETNADGRLRQSKKVAKVDIARRFIAEGYGFKDCFDHMPDLRERIAKLVETIDRWNKD
jgi:energy-coupling factor transporter ATP-binding protein EcfA2